ncbi:MAG TPA: hypothetical protein VJ917_06505, partial [Saprospiraceae bacterium]|nr:hypothetical protein [Saprospiraceae bacterium]
YTEIQFQENYFKEFNEAVAPYFIFDKKGNILDVQTPIPVSQQEKKILLTYLWKIEFNRRFIMRLYEEVQLKIRALKKEIERELNIR